MNPPTDEAALLKAFIEHGDRPAAGRDDERRALVELLRPKILWQVSRNFPALLKRYRDLEPRCFIRLILWRKDGRLAADESLWHLARRLVRHEGEMELARLKAEESREEPLLMEPAADTGNPEEIASRHEIIDRVRTIFAALPEIHAKVLEAFVAETLNLGPPMHLELECDPALARKRLERARVALAALALEAGLAEALGDYGVDLNGGKQ
jgi:hypothetical protein